MLKKVFDLTDVYGRGRARILISSVFDNVVGQLINGVFFTSFLLYYGMDKSQIGFLTFVPGLACILTIFSPLILERFQKRKAILVTAKLIQFSANCIGITILPMFVKNQDLRLVILAVLLCLSTSLSLIFNSGWTAWHASYLQDHVVDNYYFIANCTINMIALPIALIVSFIADHFADTPNEILLLTVVRFIAFVLVILDAFTWFFQKEFPYEKSAAKLKISNVFILPFRNKKFMMVMGIIVMYNFAANLPNGTINAYLLEDVKVSYTLITAINASYFLFFLLFTKMWLAVITKFNRYYALAFAILLQGFSFIFYAFVTADTIWLYVLVRLIQHVSGVCISVVPSSIFYEHLPATDRTYYTSFNVIACQSGVYLGVLVDTILATILGSGAITIFGIQVFSTQISLLLSAVGQILLCRLILKWSAKLTQ